METIPNPIEASLAGLARNRNVYLAVTAVATPVAVWSLYKAVRIGGAIYATEGFVKAFEVLADFDID